MAKEIPLDFAVYGDVVKFTPLSRRGELIRFVDAKIGGWRDGQGSESPYSHDAIYDRFEDGQHWMFESDGAGVQHSVILTEKGNFDVFRPRKVVTRHLRPRAELAALCNRRKYDFLGLLKILRYYLTGKGGTSIADPREFWCSELVNWAFSGRLVKNGPATPRTTLLALL